jgi:hypothetical protein
LIFCCVFGLKPERAECIEKYSSDPFVGLGGFNKCAGSVATLQECFDKLGRYGPHTRRCRSVQVAPFEPEVILLAVGWYLRFSLSYRDVEELLAERGLHADHVTVWRWVQRYATEIQRRKIRRMAARFLCIFLDESGNRDFSSNGSRFFRLTGVIQERPFEAYK